MPSPFPGMNPYLEQDDAFHDFHENFIPVAREMLSSQVSPAYIVKIEENIYVHERAGGERRLLGYSDVSVSERPGPSTWNHGHASGSRSLLAAARRCRARVLS
jgi:hypothetical protein